MKILSKKELKDIRTNPDIFEQEADGKIYLVTDVIDRDGIEKIITRCGYIEDINLLRKEILEIAKEVKGL